MLVSLYLWHTLDFTNLKILLSIVAIQQTLFIDHYGNVSSWCSVIVIEWGSEEVIIPYRAPDGKVRRYFPDFYIKVKEKSGKLTKYIIEIKPKKQTQPPNEKNKKTAAYRNAALTYVKNQTKWSAAREYCEDRQMNFLILTEDHLGV